MPKVIIISGTPGTGKSHLAKLLAEKLAFKHLNLKLIIKEISESYDRKKQCYIVDVKKLNKELVEIIKKEKRGLIIDSHLSHHLPSKYADLCLVLQCLDLKRLRARLKKRGYSKKKIEENLQSEIFGICLNEAREQGHRILVVDSSRKIDFKRLSRKIINLLWAGLNWEKTAFVISKLKR